MKRAMATFVFAIAACGAETHAVVLPGLGNLHHPIATTNPEAQKFFDQGLTLVYAFNHEEAVRSFERAAELDPLATMPVWGIALALGPNINDYHLDFEREKKAFDTAQKALLLGASSPNAEEKAFAGALVKRYSAEPKADLKRCALDYAKAMRELKNAYPDDLDAATLFAESLMDLNPWKLWTPDGKPLPGTEEILAVLRGVIKRDPNHIGANHYFIHSVEASTHPEDALPSAERMGKLTPGAGHLVHMPGHIYLRTGDYNGAAVVNDAAAEADRKYFQITHAQGIYQLYYGHNLTFISVGRAAEGRFAEAMQADREMSEDPAMANGPMSDAFGAFTWFTLLQFHRWDEILKLPPSNATMPLVRLTWHMTRGEALAMTGKTAEAEAELTALEEIRGKLTGAPDEMSWSVTNTSPPIALVAKCELAARIAEAKGKRFEAILAWRQAVAAQDALAYDEPPDWYRPLRQSLGAALLETGQYAEAEKAFREDLDRNPRNGRSLFGLLVALREQKKDPSSVQAEFDAAWRWADGPLKVEDL